MTTTTTTITASIEAIAATIQTRIEQQLEARIASAIEQRIASIIEERMEAAIEARLNAAIDARLEAIIEARLAAMPIEHIEQMVATAEQAVQQAINTAFDRLAGITPPPLPTDAGDDARKEEAPAVASVEPVTPEPTTTDTPTITSTPETTAQTDEHITVAACSPVLSDPATAEPALTVEEVLPDGVEVVLPPLTTTKPKRGRKNTK